MVRPIYTENMQGQVERFSYEGFVKLNNKHKETFQDDIVKIKIIDIVYYANTNIYEVLFKNVNTGELFNCPVKEFVNTFESKFKWYIVNIKTAKLKLPLENCFFNVLEASQKAHLEYNAKQNLYKKQLKQMIKRG